MLLPSILLSFIPTLWLDTMFSLSSIHLTPSLGTDHDHPSTSTPRVRTATLDDAHAIAQIIVEAFAPAPHWQYVYQFKDKYPTYHLECMQKRMAKTLLTKSEEFDVIANVIDSPKTTKTAVIEHTDTSHAVSVAIWLLVKQGDPLTTTTPLTKLTTTVSTVDCTQDLDVNTTRRDDFGRQEEPVAQRYARSPYSDTLYLATLATRPDWDGHGFAATHLRFGQDLAAERGINVTLIATPAGYPVYKSVGFESVENLTITRLDGDGVFWFEGMRWEAGMRVVVAKTG